MIDIICPQCGLVNDYRVSHAGEHKTAYCNGCNRYLKHLPQGGPAKLHFGKYKGREIDGMLDKDELGYLKWLLNLPDLKENLKSSITKHLEKI